jgi:hypothetical protein
MSRESFRYFERSRFFLDVSQWVDFSRLAGRSGCFEEMRGRLHATLMRIPRGFRSRAEASDEGPALEVAAHSGMMKEMLHSLPRPWLWDLPERVTGCSCTA